MRKVFKNFVESFKKDEKGMTLVELLAVIVILAIVGAIAFVAIGNVIDNSRKDAHVSNAQQIISAAELFEASGGDVSAEGFNFPGDLNTLEQEIVDPWDNSKDSIANFKLSKVTEGTGDDAISVLKVSSDHTKCKFDASSKTELSTGARDICGTSTAGAGG